MKPAALFDRPGALLAVGAVVSVAAIGAALVSQHVYDMQPCPWCVLQRLVFAAIALVCIVGLAWRSALGRHVVSALTLLLCVGGVVAALWQHFVAAASASCNLTLADRILTTLQLDALLPEIFQPRASCADAAVSLAGIPYEFYSLALFVLLGALAARVFVRAARP